MNAPRYRRSILIALGAASFALLANVCNAQTFLDEIQQRGTQPREKEEHSLSKQYQPERIPSDLANLLESGTGIEQDPQVVKFLNDVAADLLQAWPGEKPTLSFYLNPDDAYGATTKPGGAIVVNTGVLRSAENEAEVAAIIAHEMSHTLLGHLTTRDARRPVAFNFEFAGLAIAAADLYRHRDDAKKKKKPSSGATDALLWSMGASTVWGDLLAPSWNRSQELDADRLGFDLYHRAGYPTLSFEKMLGKVANEASASAPRLDAVRQVAQTGAATKIAQSTKGDSLEAVLAQQATAMAVNKLFEGLSTLHAEHGSSKKRLEYIKAYQAKAYTARADKVLPKNRLPEVQAGAYLQADALALAALAQFNQDNWKEGSRLLAQAQRLGVPDSQAVVKAGILQAEFSGQRPRALELTQRWTNTEFAPASAFLLLAQFQAQNRDVDAALASLDRGKAHIGRSYRFMPAFVSVAKQAGLNDAALYFARECYAYQNKEESSFASVFGGGVRIYETCSATLGRDVNAEISAYHDRRNQEILTRKPPKDQTLSEAFEALGNLKLYTPLKSSIRPLAEMQLDPQHGSQWEGVLDSSVLPLPIAVAIRNDENGSFSGRFEMRTMGCTGELMVSEAKPKSLLFETRVETGQRICTSGEQFRFYLLKDGTAYLQRLKADKKKSAVVAGGVLARR